MVMSIPAYVSAESEAEDAEVRAKTGRTIRLPRAKKARKRRTPKRKPSPRKPLLPGEKRPHKHKLVADEATIRIVTGLGQIQATSKECAAVLHVAEQTWITFCKIPEVRAALEDGQGEGRASLRRRQFEMASKTPSMAIWLGKQYLGQKDQIEEKTTQTVINITGDAANL